MEFNIGVLPGDGIGPEVIAEAVKVLDAVASRYHHRFNYSYDDVGGAAIDKYGVALPPHTLEMTLRSHAVLFGAVGGPKWDNPQATVRPEQGLLALRKHLRLFANLRPVKIFPQLLPASPLKPERLSGVDLLVVRELTGGLYYGKPKRQWETHRGRRGVDTLRYTEQEIRRILQVGFVLARGRQGRLTSVDKANVLATSRLWRQVATEVAAEYPDVTLEHMLVDNCAMQLIMNPAKFDVVVTENTFGDILTDEAAVLAGSPGTLPSASLSGISSRGSPRRRSSHGLYEPIHGSAPDIAGQGKANPIAAILSAGLMLRYSLGLVEEAGLMEKAVEQAIADGYRTPDITTSAERAVTTQEMGMAIAEQMRSL